MTQKGMECKSGFVQTFQILVTFFDEARVRYHLGGFCDVIIEQRVVLAKDFNKRRKPIHDQWRVSNDAFIDGVRGGYTDQIDKDNMGTQHAVIRLVVKEVNDFDTPVIFLYPL